jgi:hypothetical protein
MTLDVQKFVAISGMSGVYKMVASRGGGLVIEDFDTQKQQFVSTRKTQFSPFETISVYTTDNDDTTTLGQVLAAMKTLGETPPVADKNAVSAQLREYFTRAVPNHDRERVHISDIKKIVKWYNFLTERDLLQEKTTENEVVTADNDAVTMKDERVE